MPKPLSHYKSTQVHYRSYKKVALDIERLFCSVGGQLKPDMMDILLKRVALNAPLPTKRTSETKKEIALSSDFINRLNESLRQAGGGDRELLILGNLLMYRERIIQGEIHHDKYIAKYAVHNEHCEEFPHILDKCCELYGSFKNKKRIEPCYYMLAFESAISTDVLERSKKPKDYLPQKVHGYLKNEAPKPVKKRIKKEKPLTPEEISIKMFEEDTKAKFEKRKELEELRNTDTRDAFNL